jgi:hypothetical protein
MSTLPLAADNENVTIRSKKAKQDEQEPGASKSKHISSFPILYIHQQK